jgi:hypothetical protein
MLVNGFSESKCMDVCKNSIYVVIFILQMLSKKYLIYLGLHVYIQIFIFFIYYLVQFFSFCCALKYCKINKVLGLFTFVNTIKGPLKLYQKN